MLSHDDNGEDLSPRPRKGDDLTLASSLVHSSENHTNPIVRVSSLTSITMETKYQCQF